MTENLWQDYLDDVFRHMQELKHGWADEEENIPYDPLFLDWLKNCIEMDMQELLTIIGTPSIGAMYNNSVDLFWKEYPILINVTPDQKASYYIGGVPEEKCDGTLSLIKVIHTLTQLITQYSISKKRK